MGPDKRLVHEEPDVETGTICAGLERGRESVCVLERERNKINKSSSLSDNFSIQDKERKKERREIIITKNK